MLPAVVFDLGKVLVDFDYSIAARKIAARSAQKSLLALHDFLSTSPLLVDYESGRISRNDFFEAVQGAIGFCGGLEEFSGYFADIFTEMSATVALHNELRLRGLSTYIFSNTNDLAVEHIRRNFPFFGNFDGYIFSYEVGWLKPQPEIYAAMEKLASRRGEDLVYLDDRPENVAAGAARGWRAILHVSPEKTRQTLAAMGIV
ncbi:MAG TPA: HAD-IA family hydrolase [Candidatus Acidoferrales bacterium]|nr:HAD-IA family hydrolase [Candidatus Acidoferrales bacterium]